MTNPGETSAAHSGNIQIPEALVQKIFTEHSDLETLSPDLKAFALQSARHVLELDDGDIFLTAYELDHDPRLDLLRQLHGVELLDYETVPIDELDEFDEPLTLRRPEPIDPFLVDPDERLPLITTLAFQYAYAEFPENHIPEANASTRLAFARKLFAIRYFWARATGMMIATLTVTELEHDVDFPDRKAASTLTAHLVHEYLVLGNKPELDY